MSQGWVVGTDWGCCNPSGLFPAPSPAKITQDPKQAGQAPTNQFTVSQFPYEGTWDFGVTG